MGFGFKLRKAFSSVFHPKNFTLGKILSVSAIADFSGIGIGTALEESPECRSVPAVSNDPDGIVSCAVQKTNSDKGRTSQFQMVTQTGGTVLFALLSCIELFVRRRVEAEEAVMKDNEVREGLDSLREILKLKSPKI